MRFAFAELNPLQSREVPSRVARGLVVCLGVVCAVAGCKREPRVVDAGVTKVFVDAGATPPPAWTPAVAIPREELEAMPYRLAFMREVSSDAGFESQVFLVELASGDAGQFTRGPQSHFPVPNGVGPEGLLTIETVGDTELHLEQLVWWPWTAKKPKPIGPASPRVRNPVLAPDGGWLVFESGHESFSDVYVMRRDGKGLQRLTNDAQGNFEPSLSPDGLELVLTSSRTGDPEVFGFELATKTTRRLTEVAAEDLSPKWSPGGRHVAFISSRGGSDQVFLMSPEGTGVLRVHPTDAPASPTWREDPRQGPEAVEQDLAWSPDGRRLAYAVRARGEHFRIWVFDLDAEKVVPVTDGAADDEAPVWSPDGRYLAFTSDRSGNADVLVMRADGSAVTQITRSPADESLPVWVPK